MALEDIGAEVEAASVQTGWQAESPPPHVDRTSLGRFRALILAADHLAGCRAGRLDGIQSKPHGPWWIVLTRETIAELRKPVRQRWGQRSSL
jgi:hypothetical protein